MATCGREWLLRVNLFKLNRKMLQVQAYQIIFSILIANDYKITTYPMSEQAQRAENRNRVSRQCLQSRWALASVDLFDSDRTFATVKRLRRLLKSVYLAFQQCRPPAAVTIGHTYARHKINPFLVIHVIFTTNDLTCTTTFWAFVLNCSSSLFA